MKVLFQKEYERLFPKVKFKGFEIKSSEFKVMGCARILIGAEAEDGLGSCLFTNCIFQVAYLQIAFTQTEHCSPG